MSLWDAEVTNADDAGPKERLAAESADAISLDWPHWALKHGADVALLVSDQAISEASGAHTTQAYNSTPAIVANASGSLSAQTVSVHAPTAKNLVGNATCAHADNGSFMYAVIDGSHEHPEVSDKIVAFESQMQEMVLRYPAVYSDRCPTSMEPASMKTFSAQSKYNAKLLPKARGCMLAHRLLWDSLLRNSPSTSHLAVFETDSVVAPQRVATFRQAMCHVQREGKDITFLGWCMGGSKSVPFCAHAYAISQAGAAKLRNKIDACGPPLDFQIRELARNRELTWGLVPHSFYSDANATSLGQDSDQDRYEICGGMVLQPWCPQLTNKTSSVHASPFNYQEGGNTSFPKKETTSEARTPLLRTDRPHAASGK